MILTLVSSNRSKLGGTWETDPIPPDMTCVPYDRTEFIALQQMNERSVRGAFKLHHMRLMWPCIGPCDTRGWEWLPLPRPCAPFSCTNSSNISDTGGYLKVHLFTWPRRLDGVVNKSSWHAPIGPRELHYAWVPLDCPDLCPPMGPSMRIYLLSSFARGYM